MPASPFRLRAFWRSTAKTKDFPKSGADAFEFVEKENFLHKGIVEDGNVITGIGMFFREFAQAVLQRLGYDIGDSFMRETPEAFTEEELTFYWSDDDDKEFLEELKKYIS